MTKDLFSYSTKVTEHFPVTEAYLYSHVMLNYGFCFSTLILQLSSKKKKDTDEKENTVAVPQDTFSHYSHQVYNNVLLNEMIHNCIKQKLLSGQYVH